MSFRFLTAGESHGKGLVGILEGLPSGIEITAEYIQLQLRRRKMGYGRGFRQQIEDDAVDLVSGVRHGYTLGSPIALLIWNKDFSAWKEIMQSEPFSGEVRRQLVVPRPGHADLVGGIKYAHSDMRNVLERSSARETTIRVAVASIARKFLQDLGIHVASRVVALGAAEDASPLEVSVEALNAVSDASPVRCTGKEAEAAMIAEVDQAKKNGDTLGGVVEVFASGIPLGLGSFSQWDRRLEGELGQQLLSLNAIKGVEIGLGFEGARRPGSQVHDEFFPGSKKGKIRYGSNNSGGIDGGMSTGKTLVARAAMKPLATLMKPLKSVDSRTGEPAEAHVERSDVTAVPSAAVIAESLVCFAVSKAILEKFGGDSMKELLPRVRTWVAETAPE